MMREFFRRGLILSTLVVCAPGCETLHSSVRKHDSDEAAQDENDPSKPKAVDSDASKLNGVNSTEKDPQPFFNKTRARSAWTSFSPEAQQIEKDLNVY